MLLKVHHKPRRCIRQVTNQNGTDLAEIKRNEALVLKQYKIDRNITLIAPIIKNNLVRLNDLATKYVKLSGNNIVYKDLVGVGVLALIKALNRYRLDSDSDFDAFSGRYVRLAMIKEVHLFNATRKPRNVWRALAHITFLNVCTNCFRRCVY